MKKNQYKPLIIIFIFFAIVIFIGLYFNHKDKYKFENNYNQLINIEEYNTYFSVAKNVDYFINSTRDKKKLYALLDQNYKDINRITTKNISKKVPTYPEETGMKIDEMKQCIKNDYAKVIYLVKGQLIQSSYTSSKIINDNYSLIVIIDYQNYSVAFYPVDNKDEIDSINRITDIDIKKNRYNSYLTSTNMTTENICSLYLTDYIEKLSDNITKAYNITNTNQSEDEFKTYINKNLDKINTAIKSCDYDQDNKIYTVYDYNDNQFIFTETSVMNYRVSFTLK